MKIKTFEDYNEFRRGKNRWTLPEFDMPRTGTSVCGLCKGTYAASDLYFLICAGCVNRNVDVDYSKKFVAVVYGLYSMSDELLYVGVTINPRDRAHNHMLTKNFKTLRAIRYFDERTTANDFEKYSICNLKPPLNRAFEKDWAFVPEDWSAKEFGRVARLKRKSAKQVQRAPRQHNGPRVRCDNCGDVVSNKKIVEHEGKTLHRKCWEKETGYVSIQRKFEEEDKVARKQAWKERQKEIREHNEKVKTRYKTVSKSKEPIVTVEVRCKYCKKPVRNGGHMTCRRKRLKELGVLK